MFRGILSLIRDSLDRILYKTNYPPDAAVISVGNFFSSEKAISIAAAVLKIPGREEIVIPQYLRPINNAVSIIDGIYLGTHSLLGLLPLTSKLIVELSEKRMVNVLEGKRLVPTAVSLDPAVDKKLTTLFEILSTIEEVKFVYRPEKSTLGLKRAHQEVEELRRLLRKG